jgi:hypothetical protein
LYTSIHCDIVPFPSIKERFRKVKALCGCCSFTNLYRQALGVRTEESSFLF